MMGERGKTVILILLVGFSVVQTGLLWYGFRPPPVLTLTPPPGPAQLKEEKETIELLAPTRAFLSLGEGDFAPLYPNSPLFQGAWEKIAAGLKKKETWLQRDWEPLPHPPDLDIPGTYQWDFPLALSLDQWRDLLLPEAGPATASPNLAQLVLAPDQGTYVHDGEGNYYPWELGVELPLPGDRDGAPVGDGDTAVADGDTPMVPEDGDVIFYRRPEGDEYSWAPGVYLPTGEISLPTFKAAVEKLPVDSVIGTFFADLSLVRTIQERDGAAIYTDGQRALRLYPSGVLEYGYPSLRAKGALLALDAAWERGRHFVEQHGGWPSEIRIGEIEREHRPEGEYCHLSYRQYEKGIPILLPDPALGLSVHSGGVTDYGRQIITYFPLEGAQPLVDPRGFLPDIFTSSPLQEGEGEGETFISALYPAYYGYSLGEGEYRLKPAWVVTVAGKNYYFEGYTGKPLKIPGAGEGRESHGLEPG